MQKREKILAAITLSAALIFIVNQFFLSGDAESAPQRVKKTAAVQKTPQPVNGEKLSTIELQERLQNWQPLVQYETWGADPFEGGIAFASLDSSADSSSTMLSGIVWRDGEALAIIGDQILRQGEKTNTLKVIKIYSDKVIARRGKDLLTLHLGQDNRNEQKTHNSIH
ncbi:MAG: hypothetical protein DWQ05_08230 [Calditrichaeota bacterium]|nr:MAG: hypothetical protein DWQ05_08230 [Calditrichota bacterium]